MSEKARKTVFTVIAAILAIVTVWIAAGYISTITAPLISTDDMGNISIDGADFTFLFKAGAHVVNFVIIAVFLVIMLIVELIVMPTVWGIFGHFAFKKNPAVTESELSYSWKVFVISSLGASAAALVVMIAYAVRAKSGAPFTALLLCWQDPLFMFVFYILKLKKQAS